MSLIQAENAPRTAMTEKRHRYIAHTDHLMMMVLDFADGPMDAPDAPHSHPHEQITYLVEGELIFFLDGAPHPMKPGDMMTVPGGVPHCVQLLTPTARTVEAFTPLRQEFLGS